MISTIITHWDLSRYYANHDDSKKECRPTSSEIEDERPRHKVEMKLTSLVHRKINRIYHLIELSNKLKKVVVLIIKLERIIIVTM